jgi:hypothetical protein
VPRREATLVLLGLIMSLGPAATVLARSSGQGIAAGQPRVVEELAISRSARGVEVFQIVSSPRPRVFPLLEGARGASVPPGAAAVLGSGGVSPPEGLAEAEVRYTVPTGASGALLTLRLPTRLDLFVLTGPGITFPIVLNQAFFAQGSTIQLGTSYRVYAAAGQGPGQVTLRLEWQGGERYLEWLWIPLAALVAAVFLWRRRRIGSP